MKFDFNEIIERSGKDAIAIDGIGKSPTGPKKPKEGFDFIRKRISFFLGFTFVSPRETKTGTRSNLSDYLVYIHSRRHLEGTESETGKNGIYVFKYFGL